MENSRSQSPHFQLHLEFASPAVPLGISQYRGNSGISIGGREIQVLDNHHNATYADGYVAAVYNQWPPLANPSRPPGEWQSLDIAYLAARYEGDRLVRNAFITIFMNGVMVHNNRDSAARRRSGSRCGGSRRGRGWPRSRDPTWRRSAGVAVGSSERDPRQCRALPQRVGATGGGRVAGRRTSRPRRRSRGH
ncbi:MAG: DUF1080 domain-containing protein [Vicinamibacterales bacterium]